MDPSGTASIDEAAVNLTRWVDESCTFPALSDLPDSGLALSERLLDEDLGDTILSNRISAGFIEIYEMGAIDADLAADCTAIAKLWATGQWAAADVGAERGAERDRP